MAERNGTTFLEVSMAFILGAIFGATFALLYAPAPGTETRRTLREKAEGLRDQAEIAAQQVKQRIRKARRVIEEEVGEEGAAEA